jgi:hypothetical protein
MRSGIDSPDQRFVGRRRELDLDRLAAPQPVRGAPPTAVDQGPTVRDEALSVGTADLGQRRHRQVEATTRGRAGHDAVTEGGRIAHAVASRRSGLVRKR